MFVIVGRDPLIKFLLVGKKFFLCKFMFFRCMFVGQRSEMCITCSLFCVLFYFYYYFIYINYLIN